MRKRFNYANLEPSPWKNGGGVTRVIASIPADSTLDTFTWRVSVAQVSASGSFSMFEGVDRILMLLDGNGVELRSAARAEMRAIRTREDLATYESGVLFAARGGWAVQSASDAERRFAPGDGCWWEGESIAHWVAPTEPDAVLLSVGVIF